MKLYHTVKLVTEIDETKMPSNILSVLKTLDQKNREAVLAGTFIGACNDLKLLDRKSTRLNSSHVKRSRMPSSA